MLCSAVVLSGFAPNSQLAVDLVIERLDGVLKPEAQYVLNQYSGIDRVCNG